MICEIHDGEKTHVGVSLCNRTAGDTYLKKEAKRISRDRAEIARDHKITAFFRGGNIMMAHDCALINEEGQVGED